MQKLRSVQVLRAVAACAVVAHHSWGVEHVGQSNPMQFGAAGVDLFFVISGFIMAHVARERTSAEFLRDRLRRIYPLWWIAVLPWLFFLPASGRTIAASLTLWPIFPGGFHVPVLGVGWTLSFELLFYAAMTLAIATRPAIPLAAYALLFVAGMATGSPLLHFLGSPMALEFLLGVVVAQLPRDLRLGLLVAAGLALLAASSPSLNGMVFAIDPHLAIWRALAWGGPAALILWGAVSLEPIFERRSFNFPVLLGNASYSIYLFHSLMIYGLPGIAWLPRFAVAVAFGLAVHLTVERRLMRFRRHAGGPDHQMIEQKPGLSGPVTLRSASSTAELTRAAASPDDKASSAI